MLFHKSHGHLLARPHSVALFTDKIIADEQNVGSTLSAQDAGLAL
jgi:hypothetical protein